MRTLEQRDDGLVWFLFAVPAVVLVLLVTLGRSDEMPGAIEVVQTPGSPVTIEAARLGLDETAMTVMTLRARGPADSFKVRVYVYDAAGKAKGIAARVLGKVGPEAQTYVLPLGEWVLEDTDRVKVMVVARRSRPSDPMPNETYCGSNFCVEERKACVSTCGSGCVARFSCKLGTTCESDCFCKSTPACGG